MEIECLSWIGHMWNQVTNIFRKNVEPLPSDIVCEILSRLPADEVLRCLSVCEEWRAVVSAPYFSRYHLTRASPVVLVQYIPYEKPFNEPGLQFTFIDLGAKMVKIICRKPTLKRANYLPRVLFSYNGFIVLEASYYLSYFSSYFPRLSSYFIVYNPITQQEVYLKKPYNNTGYICAIYFHSLTGEYRTIYTFKNPKAVTHCWSYLTSALTVTNWFRLPITTFAPPLKDGPVNINGFVYWMIDTKAIDYTAAIPPLCTAYIIAFNTKTEEIRVMAHPGTACSSCGYKQKLQLLHVENRCCGDPIL